MKRNYKQRQKGLVVSSGARHWIAVKCRSWVNRVISSAHKRLPLLTQHQTYRCIALSDEKGHFRNWGNQPLSASPGTVIAGDDCSVKIWNPSERQKVACGASQI